MLVLELKQLEVVYAASPDEHIMNTLRKQTGVQLNL